MYYELFQQIDDISCYTNAIFFGKEKSLFVFDVLLFLFIDYFTQNYILAAFVVYIVTNVRVYPFILVFGPEISRNQTRSCLESCIETLLSKAFFKVSFMLKIEDRPN